MKEYPENFRETMLARPVFNAQDVPNPDYEANKAAMDNELAVDTVQRIAKVLFPVIMFATGFVYTATLPRPKQGQLATEPPLLTESTEKNDLIPTEDPIQEIVTQNKDQGYREQGLFPERDSGAKICITIEVEEGEVLTADDAYLSIRNTLRYIMQSSKHTPSEITIEVQGATELSYKEIEELLQEAREEVMRTRNNGPTA